MLNTCGLLFLSIISGSWASEWGRDSRKEISAKSFWSSSIPRPRQPTGAYGRFHICPLSLCSPQLHRTTVLLSPQPLAGTEQQSGGTEAERGEAPAFGSHSTGWERGLHDHTHPPFSAASSKPVLRSVPLSFCCIIKLFLNIPEPPFAGRGCSWSAEILLLWVLLANSNAGLGAVSLFPGPQGNQAVR